MEKLSILIADYNKEFSEILSSRINMEDDMQVVGIAKDGLRTLDMISSMKPDIVLLDMVLPKLEGIGVMEKLKEMENSPKLMVIVLSAINQDIFIQKTLKLGAEYYIIKPFDIDMLILRIRELSKVNTYFTKKFTIPSTKASIKEAMRNLKEVEQDNYFNKVEIEVSALIRRTGISPHISGYQYLREAIILSTLDSKNVSSMAKILYPAVAKKFNSTAQKVEHSIKNSIESAWTKRKKNTSEDEFGFQVYGKGKPSNSEFIAIATEKVKATLNNRELGKPSHKK